ncbi:MAG: hypothetical protein QM779_13920 [Propionicimonas sp.]|uniref:hypothetical protein n=1 Tax=Propionicimonas sp. TaxID=1955623 RepID=UPI003D12B385
MLDDDPLGRGASRQRLSEDETTRRMIEAGVRMAAEQGLRVSFDLARFEDVIVAAGVSRSAVYKIWQSKDLFYVELLLRLAGETHPVIAAFDLETIRTAVGLASEHSDWLSSTDGRRSLFIEMCRLGALQNFNTLVERSEWQTYMALHATLLSLPGNQFQQRMREALGKSQRGFIDRMASFYGKLRDLLGFKFRDSVEPVGLDEFAALGEAIVIGLALTASSTPELAGRRFVIDPFLTGQIAEWSYPALGFASIATALLEEDPSVTWDDARLQAVAESLEALVATKPEEWADVASEML